MKVLFNVNSKVSNLTAQNAQKNIKELPLAQEQNYTAGTAFKGTEAVKSVLKAQENMRVPKTVTGVISFKGNPDKNNNQIASIASEYQGLPAAFNNTYKIGGLANVAGEASIAFKKEGMDIRTFIPYHAKFIDNGKARMAEGGIFVRANDGTIKNVKNPAEYPLDETKGEEFVLVAGVRKAKTHPKTKKEVTTQEPTWIKLTRTNISGSVPYLDEVDQSLAQKEDKYTLFELKPEDLQKALTPELDDKKIAELSKDKPKLYVVHTEGLAKLSKAYGGNEGDAYFSNFDREYANFTRAIVGEILPKMSENKDAKEAFENYNPAGYWLHDRFAFPAMLEASKRAADGDKYFSGLRMHATYHNPGRDYQGHYDNPLDFIKTIGAIEILDTLAQDKPEDAKLVISFIEKIKNYRESSEERKFASVKSILGDDYQKLEEIFEPYIGQFKDELGSYNMSLIPHASRKTNEGNFTHGTVSMNYGKEMINAATPEIALGITSILKEDEKNMVNITNGSYAVNLKLDKPEFDGAPGLNKLAKAENGYTPLVRDAIKSADELDAVKKANVKWAINAVSKGFEEAKEAGKDGKVQEEATLKNFFFENNQEKSSILGGMAPYEEGDKLFFGWGRGDKQKGIPTTLEAFKQFYSDKSIDEETKKHTKLILGAGPWDEDVDDWKAIQKLMKEISKIDGGKYANNVVYVNGRIPNKIAACADYTIFTSRYEPCGITPLESYSAGTPVISIATGGAPDFITDGETGFLTEHAFYTAPEKLGGEEVAAKFKKLPVEEQAEAIDNYRIEVLGQETKDCIVKALEVAKDQEKYKEMAFNCFGQKVEWNENDAYNNGTSANDRYFEEAFGVTKKDGKFVETTDEAHPTEGMSYATGEIKSKADKNGREDLSFDKLTKQTIAEVEPVEETETETVEDAPAEEVKPAGATEETEEVKPTEETEEVKPAGATEETEEVKPVEEEKPEEQTDGDKKGGAGKKIAAGVGIAAAIIALGTAIKKFFGGKDKKAKKASGAKAKTPKAPKPSAAKAKVTTTETKTQEKPQTKDFSKYLK